MTDRELDKLLEEIENGPLLSAPVGMKDEILKTADRMDARKDLQKKIKKRGELILYSLEVTAVTAAAVVLIMISPLKDDFNLYPKEKTEALYISKEHITDSFFDKAQKILSFGDFMDDLDNKRKNREE